MTRSRKKRSITVCSKPWYPSMERGYRHTIKRVCHKIKKEFKFDPDKDWEEAQANHKKRGDWGTSFGFPVQPNPDDSMWNHEHYEEGLRK